MINPAGDIGHGLYGLSSGYGQRIHPVTGSATMHNGIDILAPEGERINSVMDGVVRSVNYDQYGGNQVRVEHVNGQNTLYMHMRDVDVQQGQQVYAGDQLGTVGQTGRVTGAHLHFELRNSSFVPLDPTECYYNASLVWEDPDQRRVREHMEYVYGETAVDTGSIDSSTDEGSYYEDDPYYSQLYNEAIKKQTPDWGKIIGWSLLGMGTIALIYYVSQSEPKTPRNI